MKAQTPQTLTIIEDLSYRISTMPKLLWIELTSKCPFKCLFCSRELLHGKGEHMDYEMYKQIISSLVKPQIIRLNYSGESIHYPQLIQAIEFAKKTGAIVELVSALSSIKPKLLSGLVESGLDRLTLSIHTTDEKQYQEIYGFGSVEKLKLRLDELIAHQIQKGFKTPVIDFAFVAMQRNINQILKVAELANKYNVSNIDIHPIIRRDEIPEKFELELSKGKLKIAFLETLTNTINTAQDVYPNINFVFSSPEPNQAPISGTISNNPIVYPWKLSSNAKIWDCDQSPWDTIHILANGDVVSCEVRDQIPMGNLKENSLSEIWNAEKYKIFRHNYHNGIDESCNKCAYKMAYIPSKPLSFIGPRNFNFSQLLKGWYLDNEEIIWSEVEAEALLFNPKSSKILHLKALLPASPKTPRVLKVFINDEIVLTTNNTSNQTKQIDETIDIQAIKSGNILISFKVSPEFIPAREIDSDDNRILGLALQSLTIQ